MCCVVVNGSEGVCWQLSRVWALEIQLHIENYYFRTHRY
jgi:hypothetical protein